jgi:hypothetical protein
MFLVSLCSSRPLFSPISVSLSFSIYYSYSVSVSFFSFVYVCLFSFLPVFLSLLFPVSFFIPFLPSFSYLFLFSPLYSCFLSFTEFFLFLSYLYSLRNIKMYLKGTRWTGTDGIHLAQESVSIEGRTFFDHFLKDSAPCSFIPLHSLFCLSLFFIIIVYYLFIFCSSLPFLPFFILYSFSDHF